MKSRPKDLMAELIVAALEVGVRNPDRQAVPLFAHPPFNVASEAFPEAIGVQAERPDPELPPQPVADALNGILETAIALGCTSMCISQALRMHTHMRITLKVPLDAMVPRVVPGGR